MRATSIQRARVSRPAGSAELAGASQRAASSGSARSTRAIVAALLSAPLMLGACSSAGPAQGSAPVVKLSYCGGTPQVRPSIIGVICATNAITARHLTWSAWGKPVSSAIGTAVIDLCAYSDCHTGKYRAVPIVVVASNVVTCRGRIHAYSTLQYIFVGPSPYQGIPAHQRYTNFWFGSHRPSPGNQTVSLTC